MSGCCACSFSAVALSGWLCMLSAFSIANTLKRKGRLPSSVPNFWETLSPIRLWCLERWLASVSPEAKTREGDFGCVPIHSFRDVNLDARFHRVDTYFGIGFRFVNMKIRDSSGPSKHSNLGGSSKFTPIVLLDSGYNLEYLHRLGHGG